MGRLDLRQFSTFQLEMFCHLNTKKNSGAEEIQQNARGILLFLCALDKEAASSHIKEAVSNYIQLEDEDESKIQIQDEGESEEESAEDLKKKQKKLKKHIHYWDERRKNTAKSKEKFAKYLKDYNKAAKTLNVSSEKSTFFNSLFSLVSFYLPNKAQFLLRWFTSTRLFLLRLNRVISLYTKPILPKLFAIGGLSYALNLVATVFQVIGLVNMVVFAPRSQKEQGLTNLQLVWPRTKAGLQQLKNVVLDTTLIADVLNDAIWLTVNILGFIFTGGLSIIANACGFSFDVFNEIVVGGINIWRNVDALRKINREIKAENNKNEKKDEEYLKSLNIIKQGIKNELKSTIKDVAYKVVCTSIILAGMILYWNPTTLPLGLGLVVGASMALGGGSVFFGFGRRVWNLATSLTSSLWNKLTGKKTPPHTPDIRQTSKNSLNRSTKDMVGILDLRKTSPKAIHSTATSASSESEIESSSVSSSSKFETEYPPTPTTSSPKKAVSFIAKNDSQSDLNGGKFNQPHALSQSLS